MGNTQTGIIVPNKIETKQDVLDALEILFLQEIDWEPETDEDISYQKGIEYCLNHIRELNDIIK